RAHRPARRLRSDNKCVDLGAAAANAAQWRRRRALQGNDLGAGRGASAQSHLRGERGLRSDARPLGSRSRPCRRDGTDSAVVERLFFRRLVDPGRRRHHGSVDHVQPAMNASGQRRRDGSPRPGEPGCRAQWNSHCCYCPRCPVIEGGCPGGTVTVGGAALGAMPVVAGGLVSSRAVRVLSPPAKIRVLSPPAKISAKMMTMKTTPAIHPHGVVVPILLSISACRSMSILRSKSLGSVMAASI